MSICFPAPTSHVTPAPITYWTDEPVGTKLTDPDTMHIVHLNCGSKGGTADTIHCLIRTNERVSESVRKTFASRYRFQDHCVFRHLADFALLIQMITIPSNDVINALQWRKKVTLKKKKISDQQSAQPNCHFYLIFPFTKAESTKEN